MVPRRFLLVLAALAVFMTLPSTVRPADAAPVATTVGSIGLAAVALDEPNFQTIANLDELTSDHAAMFRLYWASFDRSPDPGGALYWIDQRDNCLGLDTIADYFARSDEFIGRYGQLDPTDFVELIYHNVLDRPGDAQGLAYWTGLLTSGTLTRGGVVLNISLSPEFTGRHPYPSDAVPARSCLLPDGRAPGRSVDVVGEEALTTVAGLTIMAPAAIIERVGFHQSSHPGALSMAAAQPVPVRLTTMNSRNRGTDRRGAIDIVVEPTTTITSPVTGTVARAGGYTLYCRYSDGFVVINPDSNPNLEVKLLHIQDVSVRAGQRVEAGDPVAANATTFPFRSQIDDLTGEPSWPHVHIEVVDPSIPRRRSSGGC